MDLVSQLITYINPLDFGKIIGFGFIFVSIWLYFVIYQNRKNDIPEKGLLAMMKYLIFIPDKNISPWQRSFAGIIFLMGLSIWFGMKVGSLHKNNSDQGFSLALSIVSLVFTFLIALWQSGMMKHSNEHIIMSFDELIDRMNEKMEWLINSYREHNFVAKKYHRFLFITTNPYFGFLSFPNIEKTLKFKNNLDRMVEFLSKSQSYSNPENILVEIICGNKESMMDFRRAFYKMEKDGKTKATQASARVEQYLKNIEENKKTKILTRVKEIPRSPQFAIIGNTLFKFTLNPGVPYTEIIEAQIVHDSNHCDKYQDTFNLFKKSLPK